MTAMTRPAMSVNGPTLYVAFELGKKDWKLAMTSGFGVQPWLRTVASRDWDAVARVLAQGRARFGLSAAVPVGSCYEAGRDGFWIHRALLAMGIANRVVDSASIEVNRRARRAKTDRMDVEKLLAMPTGCGRAQWQGPPRTSERQTSRRPVGSARRISGAAPEGIPRRSSPR